MEIKMRRVLQAQLSKEDYKRGSVLSRRDIFRDILRNTKDKKKYKGINEHKMGLILNRIFELKTRKLYSTGIIHLGEGLGDIVIRLKQIKGDSYKYQSIIWRDTLKLWRENDEARKNKVYIRNVGFDKIIEFKWINRSRRIIKKLAYYTFKANRTLSRKLYHDTINNKEIFYYE